MVEYKKLRSRSEIARVHMRKNNPKVLVANYKMWNAIIAKPGAY